ncbi:MAG TPA: hypothetical protein VGK17_24970 [Propionicimonas sp.]|jgi:hypothetical protein
MFSLIVIDTGALYKRIISRMDTARESIKPSRGRRAPEESP